MDLNEILNLTITESAQKALAQLQVARSQLADTLD